MKSWVRRCHTCSISLFDNKLLMLAWLFLPRDAVLARYMLAPAVYPSVLLSQAGIVLILNGSIWFSVHRLHSAYPALLPHAVNCARFCFCAVCDYFAGVWNIFETVERICAKFTGKTCMVTRSDGLNVKVEGQRSRCPGTKLAFSALSVACVRFEFRKTSLVSYFKEDLGISRKKVTYLWNLIPESEFSRFFCF